MIDLIRRIVSALAVLTVACMWSKLFFYAGESLADAGWNLWGTTVTWLPGALVLMAGVVFAIRLFAPDGDK